MPIYEYGCETCNANFEKLMKMNAPAPVCPECGSDQVKKGERFWFCVERFGVVSGSLRFEGG